MKGTADKAEGAIKDTAGKFTGDKELQLYKEALTTGRIEILHPSFGRNRDTECGIVQGADQGADARSR